MTLLDFDKKELHDIYSSLQYTRLEIGFANEQEEELYKIECCIEGDGDNYKSFEDPLIERIIDKIQNSYLEESN